VVLLSIHSAASKTFLMDDSEIELANHWLLV
jgi:hypothetical protein